MANSKVTIPELQSWKGKRKFTMLTAYDAPLARLVDQAGIDVILVGDSLGMVMLGYSGTSPVTMDEMIHHAKAVGRTAKRSLLVGDMPFMSYQADATEAIHNAGRHIKEAGMDCVKLEGTAKQAPIARVIVDAGIAVIGHIGLTPQTAASLGGRLCAGRRQPRRGPAHSRRRAGDGGGWLLGCADGSCAGGAGWSDHPQAESADDRHWRWTRLRWPGAGDPRDVWTVRRLWAAVRPPLRRSRRAD